MNYYRSVFKNKFPNLRFHLPKTDTCRICYRLHCEVKAATGSSDNVKVKFQLRHRKAEEVYIFIYEMFICLVYLLLLLVKLKGMFSASFSM